MRLNPLIRLLTIAAVLGLTACDLGTTNGDGAAGRVSFSLPFSLANATVAAQQRVESGGDIDRIEARITVKSTGEVVLTRTVRVGDPDLQEEDDEDPILTLRFRIPDGGEAEVFTLLLEGFLGNTKNYTLGPVDFQLGSDGRSTTVSVQAVYVGPGSNVTGVELSPRSLSVGVGQTANFTCTGLPGNVTQFPYEVETVNPGVASVVSASQIRGSAVGSTELVCRLGFGSRTEDRIPVTVTGGPTITIVSGGNQNGTIGQALPAPVVVQVRRGDGAFLPNVTVTFTPNANHGTALPATAVTNSQGQATTVWTLGSVVGTETLRASATVDGLPISIDITAQAGGTGGGNTGTINGTVQNNQGVGIQGATLELRSGSNNTSGNPISTTTSNASGLFTFAQVPAGAYTVRGTASGHSDGSTNVTVTAGAAVSATLQLTAALQGAISGVVSHAQNGSLINGALVELRAGSNNTTGALVLPAVTTGTNGLFNFQGVIAGQYTVRVTAQNFTTFTANITVVANQTTQVGAALVPTGTTGVTIVLSWGATPQDLDAHLITPQGVHIFYGNQGTCSSVCLDNDAQFGFGPETMTIAVQSPGDYSFAVHNWSDCSGNGTALAGSGATVRVHFNGVLQQTFTVPNQGGTTWNVLRLNGTTITPVNTMASTPPVDVGCGSFGPGASAAKKIAK